MTSTPTVGVLPSNKGPSAPLKHVPRKPVAEQVVVVMGASNGIGRAT
jgi:hypothetical protein